MNPSEKRVSGEVNSNGGDGSNLQVQPHSDNKKVCPYCNREFECARGLGGHIKIHYNRGGFRSSAAAPLRRDNEVSGGEITDLSKSLVGCGWKVHKRRGSNEVRNKRVLMESDSSYDDYVECHSEDSCDEDDYDNVRLRKKLRRHGFTTTAHKICWTKRVLMCKVCNEYFKTYSAVFRHLDECAPTNNDVEEVERENEENGEQVDLVGGEVNGDKVAEAVSEKSGGGGSMEKQASTSVPTHKAQSTN